MIKHFFNHATDMVSIDIKPVKPSQVKLYRVIVNKIISMIYSGELKYGDKLYKESDLIEMLNVSRSSLREALRVLEFMNIVTVNPKLGIVIGNPSDYVDFPPLRSILEFESINPLELIKLRKSLEFLSIEAIIQDFDEEKKKALNNILKQFDSTDDAEALFEIDINMHLKLIELGNNNIATKLYNTFSKYLLEQGIEYSGDAYNEANRQFNLDAHKNVIKSILKQDVKEALDNLNVIFDDAISKINEMKNIRQ